MQQTAELPGIGYLATKTDIKELRLELKGNIREPVELTSELRRNTSGVDSMAINLEGKLDDMKHELIWWIISTGAVSTLAKMLLIRLFHLT